MENYPDPERQARILGAQILKERLLGGEVDNEIKPTYAEDGTPRIRGYVESSEDTFSLLNQKAAFVGVAYPEDKILMEISTPGKLEQVVRFIEFDTKTHEVTAHKEIVGIGQEARGKSEEPEELPEITKRHYMEVLNYFSHKLTTSLAYPYEEKLDQEVKKLEHESETGSHYFERPNAYEFNLPQLK
jgi:hypothetical protein